jgi:hypothetical protein
MPLDAKQARELGGAFRNLSVALGNLRFDYWDDLSKDQRDALESAEWTLLNYSSDLVTQAVGLALDESKGGLQKLQAATARAQSAVETIHHLQQAVAISALAIKLGAAIVAGDVGVISTAAGNLLAAATA